MNTDLESAEYRMMKSTAEILRKINEYKYRDRKSERQIQMLRN
jgi:hypothetical protein